MKHVSIDEAKAIIRVRPSFISKLFEVYIDNVPEGIELNRRRDELYHRCLGLKSKLCRIQCKYYSDERMNAKVDAKEKELNEKLADSFSEFTKAYRDLETHFLDWSKKEFGLEVYERLKGSRFI